MVCGVMGKGSLATGSRVTRCVPLPPPSALRPSQAQGMPAPNPLALPFMLIQVGGEGWGGEGWWGAACRAMLCASIFADLLLAAAVLLLSQLLMNVAVAC